MAAGVPITDVQRRRIRKMRAEGYTIRETAQAFHLAWRTVWEIAPGQVGKVPNDRLREAFLASPVSAADVARYLGWDCGHGADSSRVRRTLGLRLDGHDRPRSMRRLIDWETGSLIAEGIGVAAWSVLDAPPDPQVEGEVEAA